MIGFYKSTKKVFRKEFFHIVEYQSFKIVARKLKSKQYAAIAETLKSRQYLNI